jgi:flavin reductase (DIM6/NTAB) family NADH-FMN oxidoreductase RutF
MPSNPTIFDPEAMSPSKFYSIMSAAVVPRPIAWVSTVSEDGVLNLAPYSFFTVASTNPPILQVNSVGHKDTQRNIAQTGQFVVNIGTELLIPHMNASSEEVEPAVDEFQLSGVTPQPSETIAVPRVAQAPIAFECVKHLIIDVGNCSLILGQVRRIIIDREIIAVDGLPDFAKLAPPSRLGRSDWGLTPQTMSYARP